MQSVHEERHARRRAVEIIFLIVIAAVATGVHGYLKNIWSRGSQRYVCQLLHVDGLDFGKRSAEERRDLLKERLAVQQELCRWRILRHLRNLAYDAPTGFGW